MTQIEVQRPQNIVDYIKMDSIIESAERTLGEKGRQFLTSILSFANSNQKIMECEPRSVYTACLTAATLDLPINQNLGFAYIIPYNNKGKMEAQFQMGYKGFIQLAIRTGKYLRLGANKVFEGQLIGLDDFSGEPIFDFNAEHNETVVGFMAYFELTNGFRKASFMSLEKVEAHGKKYSQSYKKNFGVWKDDFEGMAKKTVLKLLLSKFAPLSTQMEEAIVHDQKVADEYADNKITFEVEGATIDGELIDDGEHIDVEPEESYAQKLREVESELSPHIPVEGEFSIAEGNEVVDTLVSIGTSQLSNEPKPPEEKPISAAQVKMLCTVTSALPKELQKIEAAAREMSYPGRSRKTFTQTELEKHLNYIEHLKGTIV